MSEGLISIGWATWHEYATNPTNAIAAALGLLERQAVAMERIAETMEAATQIREERRS